MAYVSPAKATARDWLASWWPWKAKAQHLALQYKQVLEEYPDVFADIARKGMAFDSTLVTGDRMLSDANAGARDLWLHIQTMADLNPEDLAHLRERTENNG